MGGCGECAGALVGAAFEALGLEDPAIVAYQGVRAPPTFGSEFDDWRSAELPRAPLRLGALYEGRGERRLAADQSALLADLWKNADPGLQGTVRDLQARLRGLAVEP